MPIIPSRIIEVFLCHRNCAMCSMTMWQCIAIAIQTRIQICITQSVCLCHGSIQSVRYTIYCRSTTWDFVQREREVWDKICFSLFFIARKVKADGFFPCSIYVCTVYPCLYPWQLNSMFHVNQNKPLAALPHEHCTELPLKGSSCSNLCTRSFYHTAKPHF